METDKKLVVLFVMNFAVTLGFSVSDTYFSVYITGLGARGLIFAMTIGLYAASKIIFSPLAGALNDRLGSRNLIIMCLILYSTVAFCYSFSTNLLIVAILRTAQGIGAAAFRPVLLSSVASSPSCRGRGSVFGGFDISFYLAAAIGPFVGGMVKEFAGFTGLFRLLFGLCLFSFILAVCFIKDGRNTAASKTEKTGFVVMARKPALMSLLIFIAGRAYVTSIMLIFLPLYLEKNLGFTGLKSGAVLSASTVAMIICLRPMGLLADRMSRYSLVLYGGFFASFFMFFFPFASTFGGVLVVCVLIGIFSAVSQPASSSILVDAGSKEGIGKAAGLFNSVMNIGFAVAPFAGAAIYHLFGVDTVFFSAGTAGIICSAAFGIVAASPEASGTDIKTV